MEKNYTTKMAEFLVGMEYDQIPADAIEMAKLLTLHVLGAALASKPMEQYEKAVKLATMRNSCGEATIWGSPLKASREDAAFANGTMADLLDWEDCAWTGHPSAGTIPAAFVMAEAEKKTGKEYLTAVVASYEGYHRIAMAEQPSTQSVLDKKRMWGLVSWQIYASAIAAGKVAGLNVEQTKQLLGAAYYQTFAPATKHAAGLGTSDIYHFAHGFAARNGIFATTLAQLGYENCYDALDGFNGAWNQVSDIVDWSWLDRDLGTRYYIKETLLKHWPANMWVQAPMDAAMLLKETYQFSADDVAEMRFSPNLASKAQPYAMTTKSVLDAQFSIPYVIGAYFMNPDDVGIKWFSKERRNDEKLIALTGKFKLKGEEVIPYQLFNLFKDESDFPLSILEVVLKDGRVLTQEMKYPKGHPKNQFTMEEEKEHFYLCVRDVMPKEQASAIIEKVENLEKLQDFSELARLTALG